MFNTFLDDKRRYARIVFWWLFLLINLFIGLFFYQLILNMKPKIVTQTVYKQVFIGRNEVREVNDISSFHTGDIVKYGNLTLCISSIDAVNFALNPDKAMGIYLRKDLSQCPQ